ncbi:hypothetical protein ACFFX0_15640 [Citricoccus parietis]|uniref:Uncharacterized protein n=1 Tax=Citricoccus parietis TaxID=592307 RepID=A0ABV5G0T8_9MICC
MEADPDPRVDRRDLRPDHRLPSRSRPARVEVRPGGLLRVLRFRAVGVPAPGSGAGEDARTALDRRGRLHGRCHRPAVRRDRVRGGDHRRSRPHRLRPGRVRGLAAVPHGLRAGPRPVVHGRGGHAVRRRAAVVPPPGRARPARNRGRRGHHHRGAPRHLRLRLPARRRPGRAGRPEGRGPARPAQLTGRAPQSGHSGRSAPFSTTRRMKGCVPARGRRATTL